MFEEESNLNTIPVKDVAAGGYFDAVDAALRRAERCMEGSKDRDIPGESSVENGVEHNGDDLGEGEEEGTSVSTVSINQQSTASNRSSQLRSRNRVLRKRNQLQKDLEHALPLAAPDQLSISEGRSFGYAKSFFMKVKERYEMHSSEVFPKFIELMHGVGVNIFSVTDLYHRVINLLEGSPDLCEEFLLLLSPKEALLCGKFMEHLALSEMSSFLRKLELSFSKQPQHLKKIHATWARLAETPDIKLETIRNAILPLLRGNTVLVDAFLELLPSNRPPESKMTDFNLVLCEDMDSEHSGEEEPFERVEIPPEMDDHYGGENCQCCCHNTVIDPAFINRTKHCQPCGMKFISGKVFMQTEHGLRPVRIEFSGNGTTSSNIKRLNADHHKLSRSRSRRGRSTNGVLVKAEECKQTVETDDETSFLSKVKSPRQRAKLTRPLREKPSSAKSLSLGRATCHRRPAVGKASTSPSPMINDQEAMAAYNLSGEEKPPTLDFSMISNVLHTEHYSNTKEDKTLKNYQLENSLATEKDILHTDIKEECLVSDELEDNQIKLRNVLPQSTNEDDVDVKVEDVTPTHISPIVEVKDTEKDCASSVPTESNQDISCASSDCDMEESSDDNEAATWTREEDRTILCTFQSEPDRGKVLEKISANLPHRSIKEISRRFKILMSLIQQMS